jgi:hypothetical protein
MTYPHVSYLGPAYPDKSGPTALRELQSRFSDGIEVRLLWCERDGRVWVAVTDTSTDQALLVPVRDGERALDVFQHPYAYAASRRADTGATERPIESDVSTSSR